MKETLVFKIADWASTIGYDDIPSDVIDLCRHQTASVLAACFGADRLPATKRYRKAVSAPCRGLAKAAPFLDKADPATACGITAGLSVALDFDDYLFLGHTGHSAVSVPLVLGAHLDSDRRETTTAQVIANEVGGRLGASVVLGPHNGQLWTFIHAATSALAASRLLGLDSERTANALALALAAPPYPSFCSLMGSDSKMTVVAEPTAAGIRAAHLAKEGMTGPLRILDEDRGFYAGFSFTPARFFLDGLGRSWVTQSIAIKPYPGCAYVDSTVDSLLDILEEFRTERGREIVPGDVREVCVEASILTTQMEALGKEYEPAGGLPSTFNINFRIPHTAAITIIAGRLTSAEFAPEFLESNAEAILKLASKVELSHSWDMTLEVVRALFEGLEPFSILANLPMSGVRRALKRSRSQMSLGLPFTLSDIPRLLSAVKLKNVVKIPAAARSRGTMADVDFTKLRLPFAARVTLRTTDGKSYESERKFPDGAPGGRHHPEVAVNKFKQEVSAHTDEEGVERLLSAIMEGGRPTDIMQALSRSSSRAIGAGGDD